MKHQFAENSIIDSLIVFLLTYINRYFIFNYFKKIFAFNDVRKANLFMMGYR